MRLRACSPVVYFLGLVEVGQPGRLLARHRHRRLAVVMIPGTTTTIYLARLLLVPSRHQ